MLLKFQTEAKSLRPMSKGPDEAETRGYVAQAKDEADILASML